MHETEHSEIKYDPDMIVLSAQNDCNKILEDVHEYVDRLRMLCDDAEIRCKQYMEAAHHWAQVANQVRELLGQPHPERSFTI